MKTQWFQYTMNVNEKSVKNASIGDELVLVNHKT